ncbi:MAG: hypothetical protein V4751_14340, partial [Pseudomonadota bacterium]
ATRREPIHGGSLSPSMAQDGRYCLSHHPALQVCAKSGEGIYALWVRSHSLAQIQRDALINAMTAVLSRSANTFEVSFFCHSCSPQRN